MSQLQPIYHFDVSIIDTEEIIDEIICELNLFKIKQIIKTNIIPQSKYHIALQNNQIGWTISFETFKNKYITINSNDELKTTIQQNASKANFKLLIQFKNTDKYNLFHQKHSKLVIPKPKIQRLEPLNGYFKCHIQTPLLSNSNNIKTHYSIQYKCQRVFENSNKTEEEVYTTTHSPFIIRNCIWPNRKYRFKVRLISQIFDTSPSEWTSWTDILTALPPTVDIECKIDDIGKHVIQLNNIQLCEWIQLIIVSDKICCTMYEQKRIFPMLLSLILQLKLTGADFVFKMPEEYIDGLMGIYSEENKSDDNGLNKHDFMSILYRLRECAFKELLYPIPYNPYCVYIWIYFIKVIKRRYSIRMANTDRQQMLLQKEDFYNVPLKAGISNGECNLYYGMYYHRVNATVNNIVFNLYENGNLILINKREQILLESNGTRHIIIRCYNNSKENATFNIDNYKKLVDWEKLYVARNLFSVATNLPYLDCMMKFVFGFVGKLISFSDSVEVFNILWDVHKKKYEQESK
eukprot:49722_1